MAEIGLGIERQSDETWRECAARYGRQYGLEDEILGEFDANVAALPVPHSEDDEAEAAWGACYEWDVLPMFVDGKRYTPQR